MLREGAVGLVCPNCSGPKSEYSVMATANAGSPYRIGGCVREFYDLDELLPDGTTAGAAYTVRTGRRAARGSAVFSAIGQAARDSAKLNSVPAKLGALGDALHAAGLTATVAGNADLPPDVIDRSVAALVMDSNGIVDIGRLRPRATPLSHEREWSGVEVIYFGASTRLDEMKPGMSENAYAKHRTEMLEQLDRELAALMGSAKPEDKLVLVSFSPPQGTIWDQVTPIAIYPTPHRGILTSSTTRTPGLVAASDFAPTVLGLLGLPAAYDMVGRAVTVVREDDAPARLKDLSVRVTTDERMLLPIAVALAAIGVLSFTGAALMVAFPGRRRHGLAQLCRIGLTTVACGPAALLLAVLAPAGSVGYLAGTAISLLALVSGCVLAGRLVRGGTATPIVTGYVITCVVVLADAFAGCQLCKFSALSSYQIAGMRFYGIGNEYAGVVLGMAALAALIAARRPAFVAIIGAAATLIFGLGSLGANYGATAATIVTFALLWLSVARKGFGARHVAVAFAVAMAGVALFAMLDWKLAGGAGSHAARATGLTEKLGGGYLGSLALRKVVFNLKTTVSVKGIVPLLAFSPFLALWFWGIQGKVRSLFKPDARVMAGVKAVLIGAAAAFLLNDSGIVFGATMVAMTVLVLLYSVLESGPYGAEGVEPCRES